jgi:hypothetical protein
VLTSCEIPSSSTVYLIFLTVSSKSKAILIVAQKSTLSFPQKWKNKTKAEWNFDENQDGLFVQLETNDTPNSQNLRMIHFLPFGSRRELAQEPFILDFDNWCLLPPLFRDEGEQR